VWCSKKLDSQKWKLKAACPSLILAAFGLCSLPVFRPEMPHMGIIAWLFPYCFGSLFASWIHYLPAEPPWLNDTTINREMRLERIREAISLWRTLALSVTFAYVALLIPWSVFNWSFAPMIVTKKDEILLVGLGGEIELLIFSVYILLTLVYESFKKANDAADMLLKLKA
jgi:hypothetical protein